MTKLHVSFSWCQIGWGWGGGGGMGEHFHGAKFGGVGGLAGGRDKCGRLE